MKLRRIDILKLFFLIFFSCEEVVNPELVSVAPVLVIDGLMNNFSPRHNQVVLSKTAPFNSVEPNPMVTDASVTALIDNREVNFFEEEKGVYLPEFFGDIPENAQIRLNVNSEGRTYLANATMPNKLTLDSVSVEKREEDISFDDGYYVTAHFTDIAAVDNFYMWEIYVNDDFVSNENILLSNDENLDGRRVDFELPFSMSLDSLNTGDTLTLYNYSLSKAAYDYYNGLLSLTVTGSPSQAIPDNPITNIRGGGLGFFNVCQIDTVRTIVTQ